MVRKTEAEVIPDDPGDKHRPLRHWFEDEEPPLYYDLRPGERPGPDHRIVGRVVVGSGIALGLVLIAALVWLAFAT